MIWDRFAGQSLYLDFIVFICAFEGENRFKPILRSLFAAADAGSIREIGTSDLVERHSTMLSPSGPIDVSRVSRPTFDLAARIRARASVKLVDALHLATAGDRACDAFLRNDLRWSGAMAETARWLWLSELADG